MHGTELPTAGSGVDEKAGEERSGEDFLQFVTCRVDQEEFALDILSVQEINRMGAIARVPNAPNYVEGVINLRGRIVPVLDLRRRLGRPEAERTQRTRIVVVNVEARLIGLIVDSVQEVIRLPRNGIEPPPSLGATPSAEFTQGVGRVGNRLLILLDLNKLLLRADRQDRDKMKR